MNKSLANGPTLILLGGPRKNDKMLLILDLNKINTEEIKLSLTTSQSCSQDFLFALFSLA